MITKESEKISFSQDLNSILELSKGDLIAESATDLFIDFYKQVQGCRAFFVFYINRFSKEVSISFNIRSERGKSFYHKGDPISWIPVYHGYLFNFMNQKSLKKILELDDENPVTPKDLITKKENFNKFLKKKIQNYVIKLHKKFFEAQSTNYWNYFKELDFIGVFMPLDYCGLLQQYRNFWSKTDLFLRSNVSDYPIFSIVDENLKIKPPFDKFSKELEGLAWLLVEREEAYFEIYGRLDKFLFVNFKQKQFDLNKKIIKTYIKSLEGDLYHELKSFRIDSIYDLITDYLSESEKEKLRTLIETEIISFLKKNKYRTADYYRVLPKQIHKKFREDDYLTEFIDSPLNMINSTIVNPETMVFSPLSSSGVLLKEQSPYYFSEIIKNIKFFKVKTTKIVKDEIELQLRNSNLRFSESEQEFLEFILKLPTIEE